MTATLLQFHFSQISLASKFEANKPVYGGTLRLGWYGELVSLNPFEPANTISAHLKELVFNRLVRLNENHELVPDLAEKWEISPDGLTYRFFLRHNVYFHDGQIFKAADVIRSLEIFSDRKISPAYADKFNLIDRLDVVSDYEITITLKESFAPFLFTLWRAFIIPASYIKNSEIDLKVFTNFPIGTGPFQFRKGEEGAGMRFTAYPKYFDGRPYLDEIQVIQFEKSDAVTNAFLRNEVDILFHLDPSSYEKIKETPGFKIYKNLSEFQFALILNVKDETMADIHVRKAIAFGINRTELIQYVQNQEGVLANSPFHPRSWAYDASFPQIPYDPKTAQALLAEAGWNLDPRTGLREKQGKQLVINIVLDPRNTRLISLTKWLRQQLSEIGIGVHFKYLGKRDELFSSNFKNSNYQAYLSTFTMGGPEPQIASYYWACSGKLNFAHYCHPDIDALFEAASQELEQGKRKKIYNKILGYLNQDQPAVFLYFPYDYHAASEQIQDAERLFESSVFYYLKDLWKERG